MKIILVANESERRKSVVISILVVCSVVVLLWYYCYKEYLFYIYIYGAGERTKVISLKSRRRIYPTDLTNDKPGLVTERLAMGNEPTLHSTKVVTHASNRSTHWISYSPGWSLAFLSWQLAHQDSC